MCGIIGYTGNKPAQPILLNGLSNLEYRGYDSAGIAFFNEYGHVSIRKTVGKVSDLRAICDDDNPALCGIGHTRWATHGGVTNQNAHPHKVGAVTLIHNGIIENYQELIEKFSLSTILRSDTDTEVACALINHYYDGTNPEQAIWQAVSELKGSFAFCILFRNFPDRVYCIRNVSPLVASHCEGASFVASDLTAFIAFTNHYFIVPEYTLLTLSPEDAILTDSEGNVIAPKYMTVDWDISAAQKNGYPHFMLKEINEQPEAFERTIAPRIHDELPDFSEDGIPDSLFEGIRDITIIACGTAMYAGRVGKTLIEDSLRIPVTVEVASEFRYETPVISDRTLVIVVSQSGETIDTLSALRLARQYTKRTLSIVNVKGSSIARESDYVLYTHAGPEIAVASTKAYTVQLSAFFLLTLRLLLLSGKKDSSFIREKIRTLRSMPEYMKKVLSSASYYKEITARLINAEDAFYIGRGLDYSLSLEGALKLKEISYIHAEAYAAGELKHGTISLIENGTPVIAIANQQKVYSKMISNIREVKARGAFVILISSDEKISDPGVCDVHIAIPKLPDEFTIFETVIVCQLLAYYTAVGKGNNPDQPRNLAKSVTVE